MSDGAGPARIICAACGREMDSDSESRFTWMVEVDDRRDRVYSCPACVRDHARSIEARLDQEWW